MGWCETEGSTRHSTATHAPVGEPQAAERDERAGAPKEEDEVRGEQEDGAHQDVERAVAVPTQSI